MVCWAVLELFVSVWAHIASTLARDSVRTLYGFLTQPVFFLTFLLAGSYFGKGGVGQVDKGDGLASDLRHQLRPR